MDTYRIFYLKCSYSTDYYVKANSPEEAKDKFLNQKGSNCIILSIDKV